MGADGSYGKWEGQHSLPQGAMRATIWPHYQRGKAKGAGVPPLK